jgi:hypothetical protein
MIPEGARKDDRSVVAEIRFVNSSDLEAQSIQKKEHSGEISMLLIAEKAN